MNQPVGGEGGAGAERLVVLWFTDVEGSTRRWDQYPQHMAGALRCLDVTVENAVLPLGGEIVRSRGEGDSHFVVFTRPSAAVRAAAVLQRSLSDVTWPGDVDLCVRVAIHAGEVRERDGDYLGPAVNHAARLRSTAHGGQVVVSRAIVELVGGALENGLHFTTLGRHQIRDVPGWTEVFQLCGPGLSEDFPPLVTIDTGLPPIAAIVVLDAVGSSQASESLSSKDEARLWRDFQELFATNFSACTGQYLKQLGDGCLALFADPDAAVAFVRAARSQIGRLDLALRSVIHVGRVEFAQDEPIGRPLWTAAKLLRRAPPDRIGLSRLAATLIGEHDDTITLD
jgi:class 3 adenylate cyclase